MPGSAQGTTHRAPVGGDLMGDPVLRQRAGRMAATCVRYSPACCLVCMPSVSAP